MQLTFLRVIGVRWRARVLAVRSTFGPTFSIGAATRALVARSAIMVWQEGGGSLGKSIFIGSISGSGVFADKAIDCCLQVDNR